MPRLTKTAGRAAIWEFTDGKFHSARHRADPGYAKFIPSFPVFDFDSVLMVVPQVWAGVIALISKILYKMAAIVLERTGAWRGSKCGGLPPTKVAQPPRLRDSSRIFPPAFCFMWETTRSF